MTPAQRQAIFDQRRRSDNRGSTPDRSSVNSVRGTMDQPPPPSSSSQATTPASVLRSSKPAQANSTAATPSNGSVTASSSTGRVVTFLNMA